MRAKVRHLAPGDKIEGFGRLFSVTEAAKILRRHERWLRDRIARSEIRVVRPDSGILITEADLAEFIERHRGDEIEPEKKA